MNSPTQATLLWQPGAWQPNRLTPIVYTVNKNGVDVISCQNIFSTSCVLSNLQPNTNYTVLVKASDIRNIYGPLQSAPYQFLTPNSFIAPTLITAARNPLKNTTAYIYYSNLGSGGADSYIANNIPGGGVLSIDNANKRFVINNISTPRRIENVTISAKYGSTLIQSNSISIPSIL